NKVFLVVFFFFSSRRRHTRSKRDWSSDVCSSDLCLLILSFLEKEEYEQTLACATEQKLPFFNKPMVRFKGKKEEHLTFFLIDPRSEERRVGKEYRYRGGQNNEKKKRGMRDNNNDI